MDVKDAVKIAQGFVADLLGSPASGFRLEEVELSDDERHWYVTLSFVMKSKSTGPFQGPIPTYERLYKRITVDNPTGRVISMKMRDDELSSRARAEV